MLFNILFSTGFTILKKIEIKTVYASKIIIINYKMVTTILCLLFVIILWFTHYEYPKSSTLSRYPYVFTGVVTSFDKNLSQIPNMTNWFAGTDQYLDNSCKLLQNNNTYYVGVWIDNIMYNTETIHNLYTHVIFNIISIIICCIIIFIPLIINSFKNKIDDNSLKYKLFTNIFRSIIIIFLIYIVIFEISSLENLKSQSLFTGKTQYDITGQIINKNNIQINSANAIPLKIYQNLLPEY